MTKVILQFIAGSLFGVIAALVVAYSFGFLMDSMGVSLYSSESDQQRNFNIFLGFTIFLALVFGYLGTKIGAKK